MKNWGRPFWVTAFEKYRRFYFLEKAVVISPIPHHFLEFWENCLSRILKASSSWIKQWCPCLLSLIQIGSLWLSGQVEHRGANAAWLLRLSLQCHTVLFLQMLLLATLSPCLREPTNHGEELRPTSLHELPANCHHSLAIEMNCLDSWSFSLQMNYPNCWCPEQRWAVFIGPAHIVGLWVKSMTAVVLDHQLWGILLVGNSLMIQTKLWKMDLFPNDCYLLITSSSSNKNKYNNNYIIILNNYCSGYIYYVCFSSVLCHA